MKLFYKETKEERKSRKTNRSARGTSTPGGVNGSVRKMVGRARSNPTCISSEPVKPRTILSLFLNLYILMWYKFIYEFENLEPDLLVTFILDLIFLLFPLLLFFFPLTRTCTRK
ncbi:hypothetical protein CDL12_02168 [Handroanthus impetiginosus]|uniref:Transmembrane protein n=1 Tax=Handroanthus impetiginosus TaxID=429701 RepID=A0A2G9I5Q7_9LAMI|nr:hypothetical protein CDL12_02168 [Handroanthus impetiginosus]